MPPGGVHQSRQHVGGLQPQPAQLDLLDEFLACVVSELHAVLQHVSAAATAAILMARSCNGCMTGGHWEGISDLVSGLDDMWLALAAPGNNDIASVRMALISIEHVVADMWQVLVGSGLSTCCALLHAVRAFLGGGGLAWPGQCTAHWLCG